MGTYRSSTDAPGGRWRVERVAETGSTNADVAARARAGEPDGLVLVADHQTAGRGRLDRRWDAPAGVNLLVSILFAAEPDLARPHEAAQRVAVAALEAAAGAAAAGVPAGVVALKWPNDLLLDGRKLGGILAEAVVARGDVMAVVVGLGMNLGWAPDGAGRLAGAGRDDLLDRLLDRLDARRAEVIAPAYRRHLATIGQRVRVELASGEVLTGTAVDLSAGGALIVRRTAPAAADDGTDDRAEDVVVTVGDVVHLRPL